MKNKKLYKQLANLEEQNRYLMGIVNKLYEEVAQVKANLLALHIEAKQRIEAKRIPESYNTVHKRTIENALQAVETK